MLGVAAKLERRRIAERTARGPGRCERRRQIRAQAFSHPTSAARGAETAFRRRDTAQRRAQLQCQSGDDFTPRRLIGEEIGSLASTQENSGSALLFTPANRTGTPHWWRQGTVRFSFERVSQCQADSGLPAPP
jgi:hypothetical protein